MLGVRVRLHAAQSAECVAQKTVILNSAGTEISRREEPLKTYPQPDGSRVTKTLWMLPKDTVMTPDETVDVRVEVGGLQLTRRVVLRNEMQLPVPLGVQASTLCTGDVPVRVGLDRAALKGSVSVVESEQSAVLGPALRDLTVPEGEQVSVMTLSGLTPGSSVVNTHAFGLTNSTTVEVSAALQPSLLAPLTPSLGISEGGTALLELQLDCAGSLDTVVTLTSLPAGVVDHPFTVPFTHGVTTARVRLRALGSLAAPVTVTATLGSTSHNVTVTSAAPAAPDALLLREIYTPVVDAPGGDVNCDGFSSVSDAYVEFHNPTTGPILLAGVALKVADYNNVTTELGRFPQGAVLGAGERAVFAGAAPSSGNAPWCAALRTAFTQGRGVTMTNLGTDDPVWNRVHLTLDGTDITSAQYVSYDRTLNESRVVTPAEGQSFQLTPGHAIDRLFTPADAEDGLGP